MELIKQIDKEIEIENKRLDKLLEANLFYHEDIREQCLLDKKILNYHSQQILTEKQLVIETLDLVLHNTKPLFLFLEPKDKNLRVYYWLIKGKVENDLEWYQRALTLSEDPNVLGLIHYEISLYYEKIHNISFSLSHSQQAEVLFLQTQNMIRLFKVHGHYAYLDAREGNYQQASERYQSLVSHEHITPSMVMEKKVKLAQTYLLKGDYELANLLNEELLNEGYDNESVLFNLLWGYYRSGRFQDFIDCYYLHENSFEQEYQQVFLELIDKELSDEIALEDLIVAKEYLISKVDDLTYLTSVKLSNYLIEHFKQIEDGVHFLDLLSNLNL